MSNLNERAARLCDEIAKQADQLRVGCRWLDDGTEIWDFGIDQPGGFAAGRRLAQVCLADLADVRLVPGDVNLWSGPFVQVTTDHPLRACMASQYAGWKLSVDDFFAMGSGPMRALAGREEVIQEFKLVESSSNCVGVLESSQMPGDAVAAEISEKCGIAPSKIKLLVAPTSSQAGTYQVVARSVETALHKLHELKFDLTRIESAWGIAPLPPVANDDLGGIGRTNDAILYGGHAVLYLRGDDESIAAIGPQTPSSASSDHGRPFAEIFANYEHDFYKVDRQLFSPAVVSFVNLDTGQSHRFGRFEPQVLAESFAT